MELHPISQISLRGWKDILVAEKQVFYADILSMYNNAKSNVYWDILWTVPDLNASTKQKIQIIVFGICMKLVEGGQGANICQHEMENSYRVSGS